jgi:arylsulfatase A-like enzyme
MGMKKSVLVLASVALAVGLLFVGSYNGTTGEMGEAQAETVTAATTQPNIVFILADDMRKDELKYMPQTLSMLKNKGMTFDNAFVSHALCCPARATIMRGQYAHNTGVWSNTSTDSSSATSGGLQAYKANGGETDNIATRLDDAGYRTGLFGKYLNGYDGSTIPAGWDRWFGGANMDGDEYYNYDVNDSGTIRHFGSKSSEYLTDVLSRKTNTFINNSASQGQPFFAYVSPVAPHDPATPAPRYLHAYDGIKAPRPPSFNEADVSDKPPWVSQQPRFSSSQIARIDQHQEERAETLRALDDLVAGVVSSLSNAGVMDNTYIFFTSDNGYHEGEHRITYGKWRPYEEDINMPLLVRGPDPRTGTTPVVRPGSSTFKMALNTDYMPTFTDLACSPDPTLCDTQSWTYLPDGRSLTPVLKENAAAWRNAILLEAPANNSLPYRPAYRGIRTVNTSTTTKGVYIEYDSGERELYDLNADLYELTNKYNAAAPPTTLVSRLQALKNCGGADALTCQAAEDAP